jgi:hypothetical protein
LDKNLVFPGPPDDIIKNERTRRWNYCGEEVYRVGMGAGGQWVAGEGVVDGAHGFRVMKIENIEWFRCANFSISDVVVSGAKILTHYST